MNTLEWCYSYNAEEQRDELIMKIIYILLFLVFLTTGFILSILNSTPINVNYYYGWLEIPLSFALLTAFILGVFLGLFASVKQRLLLRYRMKTLKRNAKGNISKETSGIRANSLKSH